MKKNPLIPMAAITGNLTRPEIRTMLRRYADMGIREYLMYPRDGCSVPYMSERWLEIQRDIIEEAAALDMKIWLYDEFNWPSGTCQGRVMEENEDFFAKRLVVDDSGKCTVQRSTTAYADILNPEAVDCFIRLTHEVYYQQYGKYFGSVILGIFTDEPSFAYFASGKDYPYSAGIEKDYAARTGRDLFEDVCHPDADFDDNYYAVLAERFRSSYSDRITDWCRRHGILLTGHLYCEDPLVASVRSCGNGIRALSGFSLPAMDEISTVTALRSAEWLTFGTVQAAIRHNSNGGLVETFALGPTDLPPARVEQMIWLEGMFNINRYLLAVSAVDARGNVKKNGWYNPMNYTNPWFEGYPELGASAAEASELAEKKIAGDVYVRVPYKEARRVCRDPEKGHAFSENFNLLLQELTLAQYQWMLLDEDEQSEKALPVVTLEGSDREEVERILRALANQICLPYEIRTPEGSLPEDLFVRRFGDGSSVILDLSDREESRSLVFCAGEEKIPFTLGGRGHLVLCPGKPFPGGEKYDILSDLQPEWRLMTDRPNTLRCNIRKDKFDFTFRSETALENVFLILRDYMFEGTVTLDGEPVKAEKAAGSVLTPGLRDLYRQTEPFTLSPGLHTVAVSEAAPSEPFLPSCFVCGDFALRLSGGMDVLYPLPARVPTGRLDGDVLPQYAGKITLETALRIPEEAELLQPDCSELYTRVYLDGIPLGGQLRDFAYPIPESFRGREVLLRVESFTSIAPAFGRGVDVISEGDGADWCPLARWFPGKYEKCGISRLRFLRRK